MVKKENETNQFFVLIAIVVVVAIVAIAMMINGGKTKNFGNAIADSKLSSYEQISSLSQSSTIQGSSERSQYACFPIDTVGEGFSSSEPSTGYVCYDASTAIYVGDLGTSTSLKRTCIELGDGDCSICYTCTDGGWLCSNPHKDCTII